MAARWSRMVRCQLWLRRDWLVLPLEQVAQQHGETARQFTLFALGHRFDLLGNIKRVDTFKPAATQQRGLLERPRDNVAFVELAHATDPVRQCGM